MQRKIEKLHITVARSQSKWQQETKQNQIENLRKYRIPKKLVVTLLAVNNKNNNLYSME